MSPIRQIFIVAVCGSLFGLRCPAQTGIGADSVWPPDTAVTTDSVSVWAWSHPHMIIVSVPDTLTFLYRPQNTLPLDSLAVVEDLRAVVNGSFFDGVRGDARHAGWLSLYGKRIMPLMDDRQLTHVVRISNGGKTIECIPVPGFRPSAESGDLEFQTGPLILDNGVLREDLIQSSINGSTPHTRTLLAILDRTRVFSVTVTDRITLSDLGAMLKRLSILRGVRLDVINLDGGSSVALYLRGTQGFNFNAGDRLPILIGFH